jgi:tetratricopeptide (TPR) repeat protein
MSMNRRNYVALIGSVGALVALGAAMTAQAADQKGPSVSKCMAKPLKEAQDAMKAGNYDLEIQKIQEARNTASCTKSTYDDYIMNSWLGVAEIKQRNYEAAAPALQASAMSEYSTPEQRRTMLKAVVGIYAQLKNNAKTIEVGQAAIKTGAADSDVYVMVAVAQDAQGQYKQAAQTIQMVVDKQSKPEEKYLQFQWDAYSKASDQADANKVIDKLVTYYPKPDYWLNALQPLLKMNINDSHLQLDVYRLMFDVGVLKQPRDIGDMAELDYDAGLPGETVSVLQKAFDDKAFTDQRDVLRYQHLLQTSMMKQQSDQASLTTQETKAANAATGDDLVGLGTAYLTYGQPDKAVNMISQGISKGGLRHPEQASLLLGIAQLRSRDTDAARRTFDKVASSGNEGYAQLGRLWALHMQGRATSTARAG